MADPLDLFAAHIESVNAPQSDLDIFKDGSVFGAQMLSVLPREIVEEDRKKQDFPEEQAMNLLPDGAVDEFGTIQYLNIMGQQKTREELMRTDMGRKLLDIAALEHKGKRAGFWEGVTRDGWLQFVPFVRDWVNAGLGVKDMIETKKTFEKWYNGDPLSEDDMLRARYYMASSERQAQQTMWAMFGNIAAKAPAIALEMRLGGAVWKAVKGALFGGAKAGARTAAKTAVGNVVRTGAQEGMEKIGVKAIGESIENLTPKGARAFFGSTFARSSVDDIARGITKAGTEAAEIGMKGQVLSRMAEQADNIASAFGIGKEEAVKLVAKSLKYESIMANPKSARAIAAYLGRRNSAMLMDVMDPEYAVKPLIRDRLGNALGFLYDAHIKGAALLGADLAVEGALGAAGIEHVNRDELSLIASGAMQDSEYLMKNARLISLGMRWSEYMSEMTGPALTEVVGAAGQALSKTGLGRLTKSATVKAQNAAQGALLKAELAAASSGLEIGQASRGLLHVAQQMVAKASPDLTGEAMEKAVQTQYQQLLRGHDVVGVAGLMGRLMGKTGIGPKEFNKFLKEVACDGLVEEMFEERFGGFVQGLYGLDDSPERGKMLDIAKAWKGAGWENKDQFWAEVLGFSLPSIARRGLMNAQVTMMAGTRGKFNQLNQRIEAAQEIGRRRGVHQTQIDLGEGVSSSEVTPLTPTVATSRSQETQTRAQFEGKQGVSAVEAYMAEPQQNMDMLAELGSKLDTTPTGSVSKLRKAGSYMAAFANALLSGNPAMILYNPSAAVISESNPLTANLLSHTAALHAISMNQAVNELRKANPNSTDAEIHKMAQEQVLAPDSEYRQNVEQVYTQTMSHQGVLVTTQRQVESAARDMLRDQGKASPTAEEVDTAKTEYSRALKDVLDMARYHQVAENRFVVSIDTQGKDLTPAQESAAVNLSSQHKVTVEVELNHNTIEALQNKSGSVFADRLDGVSLDQITAVANKSDRAVTDEADVQLARTLGLDILSVRDPATVSHLRRVARMIAGGMQMQGVTLHNQANPSQSVTVYRRQHERGHSYFEPVFGHGTESTLNHTAYESVDKVLEELNQGGQWVKGSVQLLTTPATLLYSANAIDMLIYNPYYFGTTSDDAISNTFADSIFAPEQAYEIHYAHQKLSRHWTREQVLGESDLQEALSIADPHGQSDVDQDLRLESVHKRYEAYTKAAETRLQDKGLTYGVVAATGQQAWSVPPGATTMYDPTTGQTKVMISKSALFAPSAIAEDMIEAVIYNRRSTFEMLENGRHRFRPAIDAFVRAAYQAVKTHDPKGNPQMMADRNLMLGILGGDFNIEAISKLTSAIVLGNSSEMLDQRNRGFSVLNAVADTLRAAPEYAPFLTALNQALGGTLPMGGQSGFDAILRLLPTMASSPEARLKELNNMAGYYRNLAGVVEGRIQHNPVWQSEFDASPWDTVSDIMFMGTDQKQTAEISVTETPLPVQDSTVPIVTASNLQQEGETGAEVVNTPVLQEESHMTVTQATINDLENRLSNLENADLAEGESKRDRARTIRNLNKELEQARILMKSQDSDAIASQRGHSNSLLWSASHDEALSVGMLNSLYRMTKLGVRYSSEFMDAVDRRNDDKYYDFVESHLERGRSDLLDLKLEGEAIDNEKRYRNWYIEDLLATLRAVDEVAADLTQTANQKTLIDRFASNLSYGRSRGLEIFNFGYDYNVGSKESAIVNSPSYSLFRLMSGLLAQGERQANAFNGTTQRLRREIAEVTRLSDQHKILGDVFNFALKELPSELNYRENPIHLETIASSLMKLGHEHDKPIMLALGLTLKAGGVQHGINLLNTLRGQIPIDAISASMGEDGLTLYRRSPESSGVQPGARIATMATKIRRSLAGDGAERSTWRNERDHALHLAVGLLNSSTGKRARVRFSPADVVEANKSKLFDQQGNPIPVEALKGKDAKLRTVEDAIERAELVARIYDGVYGDTNNPVSDSLRDHNAIRRMWTENVFGAKNRKTGNLLNNWIGEGDTASSGLYLVEAAVRALRTTNRLMTTPIESEHGALTMASIIDRELVNDVVLDTSGASVSGLSRYNNVQHFLRDAARSRPVSNVTVGIQKFTTIGSGSPSYFHALAQHIQGILTNEKLPDHQRSYWANELRSVVDNGTWSDGTPLISMPVSYAAEGKTYTRFTGNQLKNIAISSVVGAVNRKADYFALPIYSGSHAQMMVTLPAYWLEQMGITDGRASGVALATQAYNKLKQVIPALSLADKRIPTMMGATHPHAHEFNEVTVAHVVPIDPGTRFKSGTSPHKAGEAMMGQVYVLGSKVPTGGKFHITEDFGFIKGNVTKYQPGMTGNAYTEALLEAVNSYEGVADGVAIMTDGDAFKFGPSDGKTQIDGKVPMSQQQIMEHLAGARPGEVIDLTHLDSGLSNLHAQIVEMKGQKAAIIYRQAGSVHFLDAAHLSSSPVAELRSLAKNIQNDMTTASAEFEGAETSAAINNLLQLNRRLAEAHTESTPAADLVKYAAEVLGKNHPMLGEIVSANGVVVTDRSVSEALAQAIHAETARLSEIKAFGQHMQNIADAAMAGRDDGGVAILSKDKARVQMVNFHALPDAFSEGSYVFDKSEDFNGFKRRPSLQRTNLQADWLRPGLFIRENHPGVMQHSGDDAAVANYVALQMRELYNRREDAQQYREFLFQEILPMFTNEHGEMLLFDPETNTRLSVNDVIPEGAYGDMISFDDLMVRDPRGTRSMVFDAPALYHGKDRKSGRIFLAGSPVSTYRTPSGSPSASDTYRISFPAEYQVTGNGTHHQRMIDNGGNIVMVAIQEGTRIASDNNVTKRTALSSFITGNDNDGDKDLEMTYRYDPLSGLIRLADAGNIETDVKYGKERLARGDSRIDDIQSEITAPYWNSILSGSIHDKITAPVERIINQVSKGRYDYIFTRDTRPVNPRVTSKEYYDARFTNEGTGEWVPDQAAARTIYEAFPMLLPAELRNQAGVEFGDVVNYYNSSNLNYQEMLHAADLGIDSSVLNYDRTDQVNGAAEMRGISVAQNRYMQILHSNNLYRLLPGDRQAPTHTQFRMVNEWLVNIANATFDEENNGIVSRMGLHVALLPMYAGMLHSRNWGDANDLTGKSALDELYAFHDQWMAWTKGPVAKGVIAQHQNRRGDLIASNELDYMTGLSEGEMKLWGPIFDLNQTIKAFDMVYEAPGEYAKTALDAWNRYRSFNQYVGDVILTADHPQFVAAAKAKGFQLHQQMVRFSGDVDSGTGLRKAYQDLVNFNQRAGAELYKHGLRGNEDFGLAANQMTDVLAAYSMAGEQLINKLAAHKLTTADIVGLTEALLDRVHQREMAPEDPQYISPIFSLLNSLEYISKGPGEINSPLKSRGSGQDAMARIDQIRTAWHNMFNMNSANHTVKLEGMDTEFTYQDVANLLMLYNTIAYQKSGPVPGYNSGFMFMLPLNRMLAFSQLRTDLAQRSEEMPRWAREAAMFRDGRAEVQDGKLTLTKGENYQYPTFRPGHPKLVRGDAKVERPTIPLRGNGFDTARTFHNVFRFAEGGSIPAYDQVKVGEVEILRQDYHTRQELSASVQSELAKQMQRLVDGAVVEGNSVDAIPHVVYFDSAIAFNQETDGLINITPSADSVRISEAAHKESVAAAQRIVEYNDGQPIPENINRGMPESSNSLLWELNDQAMYTGEGVAQQLLDFRNRGLEDADKTRVSVTSVLSQFFPYLGETHYEAQRIGILQHDLLNAVVKDYNRQGGVLTSSQLESEGGRLLSKVLEHFPGSRFNIVSEVRMQKGQLRGIFDLAAVDKKTGEIHLIDLKPYRSEAEWARTRGEDGRGPIISHLEKHAAQLMTYQGILRSHGFNVADPVHVLMGTSGEAQLRTISPADRALSRATALAHLAYYQADAGISKTPEYKAAEDLITNLLTESGMQSISADAMRQKAVDSIPDVDALLDSATNMASNSKLPGFREAVKPYQTIAGPVNINDPQHMRQVIIGANLVRDALRDLAASPDPNAVKARGIAQMLLDSPIMRLPRSQDLRWGPQLGLSAQAVRKAFDEAIGSASHQERLILEETRMLAQLLQRSIRSLQKFGYDYGDTALSQMIDSAPYEAVKHFPLPSAELLQARQLVPYESLSRTPFKLVDGSAYFQAAYRPAFRGQNIRNIVSNRILEGFSEEYLLWSMDLQEWYMISDIGHVKNVYEADVRLELDPETNLPVQSKSGVKQRGYERQTALATITGSNAVSAKITSIMNFAALAVGARSRNSDNMAINAKVSTQDFLSDETVGRPTGADIQRLAEGHKPVDRHGKARTTALSNLVQQIQTSLPEPLRQPAIDALVKAANVASTVSEKGVDAYQDKFLATLAEGGWVQGRYTGVLGEDGPRMASATFAVPIDLVQDMVNKDADVQALAAKTGRTAAMAPTADGTVAASIFDINATAEYVRQLNQELTNKVMSQMPLTMGAADIQQLFGTYDDVPFTEGLGFYHRGNVAKYVESQLQTTEKALEEAAKALRLSLEGRSAQTTLREMMQEGSNQASRQINYLIDLAGDTILVRDENTGNMRRPLPSEFIKNANDGVYALTLGIPKNSTRGDIIRAIHTLATQRIMENAITTTDTVHDPLQTSEGIPYGALIRLTERYARNNNIALDSRGLNDAGMYNRYGVLPANIDAFTALATRAHKLADGIRFRAAINEALMVEDAKGSPLIFIKPGSDRSFMVSDQMWDVLVPWWEKSTGIIVDSKLSSREKATLIFDELAREFGTTRTVGHGVMRHEKGGKFPSEVFSHIDKTGIAEMPEMLVAMSKPGEQSSILGDLFVGGDAAGMMKQLLSAVASGNREHWTHQMDLVVQWSKAMSMAMSFFHLVATGGESAAAALGNVSNIMGILSPEMARKFGTTKAAKPFGISEHTTGITDFIKLIHSPTDPYMIQLRTLMRMVNVPLSSHKGNPLDVSRTALRSSFNKMVSDMRNQGIDIPNAVERNLSKAIRLMTEDNMEYTFEYVTNAVKMAAVSNLLVKLQNQASQNGRWFDPIGQMKKWGPYTSAEVGGMDPVMYPWATPQGRAWMNRLIFSWNWTMGAWEAGGLGFLTHKLTGFKLDPKVQRAMPLRWARMYAGVMFGVPAMLQMISKGIGLAAGIDDDDDKWFIWNNEIGKKHAFNMTPALRAMAKIPGALWVKDNVPVLGKLVMARTGDDPTQGDRKVYGHFGKQAWEIGRWFTNTTESAFSKTSLPVQKFFEAVNGSSLNSDWNYEFKGKNLIDGLWGRTKHWGTMFVPFSFATVGQNSDVGAWALIGPVGKGVSGTAATKAMSELLYQYANNDTYDKMRASPKYWNNVDAMLGEWADAARVNGHDPAALIKDAKRNVLQQLYREYYSALPRREGQKPDWKKLEYAARGLHRMDFAYTNLLRSIAARDERHGKKLNITEKVKASRDIALQQSYWNPHGNKAGDEKIKKAIQEL